MYIRVKKSCGFGNLVSKSERKTKRQYKVNNQTFRFYSKSIMDLVSLRCDCRLFRTINKYSSFDDFILNSKKIPKELEQVKKTILKLTH